MGVVYVRAEADGPSVLFREGWWLLGLGLVLLPVVGCTGGKVATNGVPLGSPGRYHPAQVEINVANGTISRPLEYVVLDLYGPQEYARRGAGFAPDARQAGFVLKPPPSSGAASYWEYYADGKPLRLAHQPGLLVLRGADGRVSSAAVDPSAAGDELYRMLWGADPNLNHLRASDPNGLALPLIRVLAQATTIRNNPAFLDWYNGFQQWHLAASGGPGVGPVGASAPVPGVPGSPVPMGPGSSLPPNVAPTGSARSLTGPAPASLPVSTAGPPKPPPPPTVTTVSPPMTMRR